jgi:hypothetical protein
VLLFYTRGRAYPTGLICTNGGRFVRCRGCDSVLSLLLLHSWKFLCALLARVSLQQKHNVREWVCCFVAEGKLISLFAAACPRQTPIIGPVCECLLMHLLCTRGNARLWKLDFGLARKITNFGIKKDNTQTSSKIKIIPRVQNLKVFSSLYSRLPSAEGEVLQIKKANIIICLFSSFSWIKNVYIC